MLITLTKSSVLSYRITCTNAHNKEKLWVDIDFGAPTQYLERRKSGVRRLRRPGWWKTV